MIKAKRYQRNPILTPNEESRWEAVAVFNGSVVKEKDKYHLVYRAISSSQRYFHKNIELSSIGYATSNNGTTFKNKRLFIAPEYKWEQFGCEDPRVTKLNDKYFIFYTTLSDFPHTPSGIKIGVAITKDFSQIEKKHQVTRFNSKAMALFPEKINGKIGAILTVGTDKPPAKIALAFFDKEEEIWSEKYWNAWLSSLGKNTLSLKQEENDHLEVGAPPVKTKDGWLLVYCHIKNYFSPPSVFGIEAVLLDLKNPLKIIGRTTEPLLIPKEEYERYGKVPNVIFPSGALIEKGILKIYYGAADTVLCLAQLEIEKLLKEINPLKRKKSVSKNLKKTKKFAFDKITLERHSGNPILKSIIKHGWESKYVFNPTAIYEDGKVHILYRAMGEDQVSVLGYASSIDGVNIKERLAAPIYVPREDFEKKRKTGYSGCEDPRITKIDDKFYLCYTAHDGNDPIQVALSSISVSDFLEKRWNWSKPKIISCPERNDKNACVMSEKIKNKYVFFHRIGGCIWIDFKNSLNFKKGNWLGGKLLMCPDPKGWDSEKVGIAGPPIKTKEGWLLIYHGLSKQDKKYRLGAILLNLKSPDKIVGKLDYPILEPEAKYEKKGLRPNTVFSCGSVVIKKRLFVYYGAADQVTCVASTNLDKLIKAFF